MASHYVHAVAKAIGIVGLKWVHRTLNNEGRWARPDLNRNRSFPNSLAESSPESLLSLVASAARTAMDDPTAAPSLLALLSTLDGGIER